MKVLIAAGGTAGHVVPALAIADALRADGAEVEFVGGLRAERELVPAAGYPFEAIDVRGIPRRDVKRALGAVRADMVALRPAWRVISRVRPDVVLGAGGYVGGVVGVAAAARRIPIVVTEADAHPGIATRMLAPLARRVCLAFPVEGREPPRYRVTGRPVPPPATDRAAARARFGVSADEQLVLVAGGSLGARSINEAAIEAFAGAGFKVLHAAGERDEPGLRDRIPPVGYDVRPWIDRFGEALAAADLVVSRSGGGVFEIAAAGRPAILIPYPHATADHQTANAQWMVDAGAAVIIPDGELTAPRLAAEVGALLGDPSRLGSMAHASASIARPDAARAIAEEVLRAAAR